MTSACIIIQLNFHVLQILVKIMSIRVIVLIGVTVPKIVMEKFQVQQAIGIWQNLLIQIYGYLFSMTSDFMGKRPMSHV